MFRALADRLTRGFRSYAGSARDAVGALPDTDDALDPDSPATLFRRVVAMSLAAVPIVAVAFVLNLFEQSPAITAITGGILLLVVALTWWMLDDPDPRRSRTGALIEIYGALVLLGLLSYSEPDGLSTPFWMAPIILIAVTVLGERAAILATGFAIAAMSVAYTAKALTAPFAPSVVAEVAITVRRALFLLVILVMGIAARRLGDKQIRALRLQRETITRQADDMAREVAERRRAQEELARSLNIVIAHATDGIVTYGEDRRIIDMNQAAAELLGEDRGSLPGRRLGDVVQSHLADVPADLLDRLTERGARVELAFAGVRPRTTEWAVSATHAGDRLVTMAIIRDITERKDLEARLFRQANYDASTGVAKVPHFMRRVNNLIANSPGDAVQGVLAVGVDDLRTVHDGHGWEFTQEILRITAERLTHLVGSQGEVGVFDGVGFLLGVCERWDDRQLADLARAILTEVSQPIELEGNRVIITASVGIATSAPRKNGAPPRVAADEYVRHAGAALNLARQRGHEQIMRYDENFRAEALNQLELDQALHIAARNREFRLVYQPIVDLRTGAVIGVEALLRWERPGWGIVLPGTFLPRLEATGLIVGVGDWVLREACREHAAWQGRLRARGIDASDRTMNVNLSALQFLRAGLPETVAAAIRDNGLRPEQVVLEVTESIAFDPRAGVLDLIDRLRDSGVRVAIDDFGTGYSSLSQLLRLNADVVKLDKSFIDDIVGSERHRAVVAAMVEVAKRLGVPTVAEGVEDEAQVTLLKEMGCTRAQGYLFARPGLLPDT